MSFLDLYQGDQEQAAKIQPNEGVRLPSTFEENFSAAWSDGRLFGQSIARANARAGVLNDYISEIRQKTGQDLSKEFIPDVAGGGQTGVTDFSTANERVAKLKEEHPDLDLAPLSDEEIDNRAAAKAQAAHQTYEKLQAGEKTLGGSFGTGIGSLAAGVTDPINIVGLAIAPETAGVGILGAALRWGALAGVSQAAIEFSSDQFKEQVQPGYMESGGPGKEIAGAFLGGAAVGGATKALGNIWTKVKTGQWPTSVRDAGNVLESEANIANTNPLPGVEGEVAHREALVKTIDDILAGRPVEISHIINPELLDRSRALISKLEGERPMALPVINRRAIELVADEQRLSARDAELAANIEKLPPGDASAADRLNRLQAVEQQIAETTDPAAKRSLNERRDQILVDTNPEKLQAAAAPIEARRAAEAERASIADQLKDISEEHARMQADYSLLGPLRLPELGQRERIPTGPKGQFEMDLKPPTGEIAPPAPGKIRFYHGTAYEDASEFSGKTFVTPHYDYAKNYHGGDNNVLYTDFTKAEAEARGLIDEVNGYPIHGPIDDGAAVLKPMKPAETGTPISTQGRERARRREDTGLQPLLQTDKEMRDTLTAPDHQDAIRADIDRERAMGDLKVPGVDENGNHIMVGVDAAMEQVDNYKKLAEQIQACANPVQEAAE